MTEGTAAFAGGHIIHGAANAMYLPKVIKFNAAVPFAAARYALCAGELGLAGAESSQEAKIAALIAWVRKLNDELNIPHCIRDYAANGLPGEGMVTAAEFESKAAQIAENAMGDACTGCNPRQMDAKLMERVLRCCWDDSEVDF